MMRRGEAILRHLPQTPPRCVEVGVAWGELSAYLLDARKDLTLVMVDPWNTWDDANDADEAMKIAIARTEFAADRRTILRMASPGAADGLPDRAYDLVFIDGDHTLEAVTADLWAWLPKVRPGGFLAGHDWRTRHSKVHPEIRYNVRGAVEDFLAKTGFSIALDENGTWFISVQERPLHLLWNTDTAGYQ